MRTRLTSRSSARPFSFTPTRSSSRMQNEADLIGGVNLDVKDRKLYFSDGLKFNFIERKRLH